MLRKTYYLLVLLPVLMLSACRSDNETIEKQNAEILAELKKLNTRMDRMEKRLNSGGQRGYRTIVNRTAPGIDMGKILKIKPLPKNPTDQQIIDYVRQIREATGRQTVFSDTDPQIALYEQIGPGHLKLLLRFLTRDRYSFHISRALPKLVGKRDRELVRQNLNRYPALLECAAQKGWLKDMRTDILQLLRTQPHSSLYAIRDHLQDLVQSPEDLKIITDVFIHQSQAFYLLDGLKRIPGVDLRKAVNQAWKVAKKLSKPGYPVVVRAQHAVQYGQNVDAFKFLLKRVMSSDPNPKTFPGFWDQQTLQILAAKCDFPVYRPADLREWYEKNADRIIYDPDEGKFVLK
ncbi:MAG: hypothetical protein IJH79_09060 [Lentisphaeria bacterium]|nr:hypothetical protein [Lentisphaeria bacterium]